MVWKKSHTQGWNTYKISLGKNKENFYAELWGISEALKIALKESLGRKIRKVTIFSDSQTAMRELQTAKSNAGQALKAQICGQARQLQNRGGELTVRWIPGHKKIEGNERADRAAKDAAANGRSQTARWSSLAHVNWKINEAQRSEIHSWHEAKNEERERRSRNYYTPRPKPGIDPVLGRALKKYASRFFQLIVGHGAVGVFLERIRVVETAECWWCRQAEQSVIHLYAKCRKWRKERRVLKRELQQLGITWQRRTEKRWLANLLANLLANEQAVAPLLKYL